jgi:hypothetical protein
MKKTEYDAAETVEIGKAQSVVLGGKTPPLGLDWLLPPDGLYEED